MKTYLLIVSSLTLASPLALAQAVPDATPPAEPAIPATPANPADPADPAVPAEGKARARSSNQVGDFAAFDANGDGKLSRDEAKADGNLNFTELDRDKDGSVSRGEYEAGARASTREEQPEEKSKERKR
ncbi:MAG: hypothetical protein ACRES8_07045 [Nevskiaceae bacterium]